MYLCEQTWRWYGPSDPISLSYIRQTGVTSVANSLHHIPSGDVWSIKEIMSRKVMIEDAGLKWSVAETLSVHEHIKSRTGDFQLYIENYKESIQNLAKCGVSIIAYNFMPILDWTRTNISYPMVDGSRTYRFERAAFIAFDLFMLRRLGAKKEYFLDEANIARYRYESMTECEREDTIRSIISGLYNSDDNPTMEHLKREIDRYYDIDVDILRTNLILFLQEIAPVADDVGALLAIHPDDPPYSILGLPRVMSSESDFSTIVHAVPNASNGICLSTGSMGIAEHNNLLEIINTHGDRVNFVQLHNTKGDCEGNFYDTNQFEGDVDMYEVVKALLGVQKKRQVSIPIRSDYGQVISDDQNRESSEKYYGNGRLRGVAELRGLELGIAKSLNFVDV